MTVGTQPSMSGISGNLTSLALAKRELANNILQQWAYLNKLGLSGLQAIGFTSQDAQTVLDDINHLATPEQVYKGTVQAGGSGGNGATLFNYEDYLTPLWAGQ